MTFLPGKKREKRFLPWNFFLTTICFCDINFLCNEVYTNGSEYETSEQKSEGADCTEKFPG